MYSRLTEKVGYKNLFFVPAILSLVMICLVLVKGIPLGIDFQGGTLIEITLNEEPNSSIMEEMKSSLDAQGFKNLRIYTAREMITNEVILSIGTLSFINKSSILPILEPCLGNLSEIDIAIINLSKSPPRDLDERLRSRLRDIDIEFNDNKSILKISAYELNREDLESALKFYLNDTVDIDFRKKNFNMKVVGPTLGKTFREQGIKSAVIAYALVIMVIFFAFRDFIPSIAVILAATFDGVFALGGMSLFNILLEPASLVAIIMLVGYSVDTDILLTSRVLKTRVGTVDERIDNAMKTGLTMTLTTLCVMLVILIISTMVIQIDVLASISSVLLLGLMGDIISTWFMNAGILKWYVEERGAKIRIRRRR